MAAAVARGDTRRGWPEKAGDGGLTGEEMSEQRDRTLIVRGLTYEQAREAAEFATGGCSLMWHGGKAWPFHDRGPCDILNALLKGTP